MSDWSTEDWARKLAQQEEWSREYRHDLYERVGLPGMDRILDVGCGTGAITRDLALLAQDAEITGIDIDPEKLDLARKYCSGISNLTLEEGDALSLPYGDGLFDLVICNLVLIHIKDQQSAVNEMARVCAPGGTVLAAVETDYNSMVEYPEGRFRELFLMAIRDVGADMKTGRKLKHLFTRAGLETVVGIDTVSEFTFITDDGKRLDRFIEHSWFYRKIAEKAGWTDDEWDAFFSEEKALIEAGLKFSWLPVYYAIGKK